MTHRSTSTSKVLARGGEESGIKTTPKRVSKANHSKSSESAAQMQIVNEILKRNPDLLKDNKVSQDNFKAIAKQKICTTKSKKMLLRTNCHHDFANLLVY